MKQEIKIPKGYEVFKKIPIARDSYKVIYRHKDTGRRKVVTYNFDVSMTDQSFAAELDNRVVFNNLKKGILPQSGYKQGQYMDLSETPNNLMDSQIQLQSSKREFDALPKDLKAIVKTPIGLVNWLQDPQNREEAVKFGLIAPKQDVSGETGGSQKKGVKDEGRSKSSGDAHSISTYRS